MPKASIANPRTGDGRLHVHIGRYARVDGEQWDRIAVVLVDAESGETEIKLSTNVPQERLLEYSFLVRYDETIAAPYVDALVDAGICYDTGGRMGKVVLCRELRFKQAYMDALSTIASGEDVDGRYTPVESHVDHGAQLLRVNDIPPTLWQAQRFVGGPVALVNGVNGEQLLVNEDGLLKGLPRNEAATAWYRKRVVGSCDPSGYRWGTTSIVGNALLLIGTAVWE